MAKMPEVFYVIRDYPETDPVTDAATGPIVGCAFKGGRTVQVMHPDSIIDLIDPKTSKELCTVLFTPTPRTMMHRLRSSPHVPYRGIPREKDDILNGAVYVVSTLEDEMALADRYIRDIGDRPAGTKTWGIHQYILDATSFHAGHPAFLHFLALAAGKEGHFKSPWGVFKRDLRDIVVVRAQADWTPFTARDALAHGDCTCCGKAWSEGSEAHWNCVPPPFLSDFDELTIPRAYRDALYAAKPWYTIKTIVESMEGNNPQFPSVDIWLATGVVFGGDSGSPPLHDEPSSEDAECSEEPEAE